MCACMHVCIVRGKFIGHPGVFPVTASRLYAREVYMYADM